MNLNAYDKVLEKIDKTKTWIRIDKKLLLSREIKYRKYYTFLKRYDPKSHYTEYYLAVLDDKPEKTVYYNTTMDNYGRLKFYVKAIFSECRLDAYNKDSNISINRIEETDDGDIYQINV